MSDTLKEIRLWLAAEIPEEVNSDRMLRWCVAEIDRLTADKARSKKAAKFWGERAEYQLRQREKLQEENKRLREALTTAKRIWEGQRIDKRFEDEYRQICAALSTAAPSGKGTTERMFPVQDGPDIPWSVAEKVYEGYAQRNGKSQTLERLAERGGFGVAEIKMYLPDAPSSASESGAGEGVKT